MITLKTVITFFFLPIPKCSFHMVCSPMVASLICLFSSSKDTFSLNSTLSATPSSWQSPRSMRTLSSSSWFLHPPIKTSFNPSLLLSKTFLKALICSRWSFSGLNWPTEMMEWHFLSPSSSSGMSRKALTSQGGYTTLVRFGERHRDKMWSRVQEELTMMTSLQEPAIP